MKFKDNLYRIRREKGLSQEDLATLCNVSRQTISKWENGTAHPDIDSLTILINSLHVSANELLGSEREPIKEKEIIYVHKRYCWSKEYTSKHNIFGVPLVHINIGMGKRKDGKRHFAKGIIAIGNSAVGVIAFGFMSAGFISIGLLTLGLCMALGPLAISYFAIGALAIGYISVGVLSIGVYSVGVLSIGYQLGIGVLAYGNDTIGLAAYGNHMYLLQNNTSCFIEQSDYHAVQNLIKQGNLPFLIEFLLKQLPLC